MLWTLLCSRMVLLLSLPPRWERLCCAFTPSIGLFFINFPREATGLCFVVINRHVLSANRVILFFLCFIIPLRQYSSSKFHSFYPPPPQLELECHVFLGETISTIQKARMVTGGSDGIIYSTYAGYGRGGGERVRVWLHFVLKKDWNSW